MNEFEENIYKDIKNELLTSVIDKKVDTYFVNRNELTHYYNVGKMIVDAQGGEERAKYGDGLIKKFSERLTRELGKGFSPMNLKYMRKFYLFQKGQTVSVQSQKWPTLSAQFRNISWSHYVELLSMDNFNEINYYLDIINKFHLSIRELRIKIKNKEYQRLDDKAKNKIINKEELDIASAEKRLNAWQIKFRLKK